MIEIIPKPIEKLPWWQEVLFYLSIILLLIIILSCFILNHFLKNSEKIRQELERNLAQITTAEEVALENEILSYQKKIGDFAKLIKEHIKASNFFNFLEKGTHPKVFFLKVDLKPLEGKATLSGETENFTSLSQEISILKSKKEIKALNLSKMGIGKEGKIDFTLDLNLEPNLFK